MYVLGLDGGGTKTEVLAAASGEPLAAFTVGATSLSHRRPSEVEAELTAASALLARRGLPPDQCAAVCAGFASAGREANRRQYESLLGCLWPKAHLRVVTDLEIAWQAAAGGADSIVVIAGTGSSAFGRYHGRDARAGGLGPGVGDQGGADWIGRQVEAPPPPAAALPAIVAAAQSGNARAGAVLERAGVELAALVRAIANELDWPDPPVVAWGGVFAHAAVVRDAFARALHNVLPAAVLRSPLETPARAALRIAHADAP